MTSILQIFADVIRDTLRDVMPIVLTVFGFQLLVLRRSIPNLRRVAIGFVYVTFGMTLFLLGLEQVLFPLGRVMALQLTDPSFIHGTFDTVSELLSWQDYKWVYVFAAAIGFSTTIAEPALLAVAMKAHQVSGGARGSAVVQRERTPCVAGNKQWAQARRETVYLEIAGGHHAL